MKCQTTTLPFHNIIPQEKKHSTLLSACNTYEKNPNIIHSHLRQLPGNGATELSPHITLTDKAPLVPLVLKVDDVALSAVERARPCVIAFWLARVRIFAVSTYIHSINQSSQQQPVPHVFCLCAPHRAALIYLLSRVNYAQPLFFATRRKM